MVYLFAGRCTTINRGDSMKKIISLIAISLCCIQLCAATYAEISFPGAPIEIQKAWELSKQYPYYTYPDDSEEQNKCGSIIYDNGLAYLIPYYYSNAHAMLLDSYDLQKGELNVYINGVKSSYSGECVLHDSVTLVPIEVFDELGVMREYIDEFYMTRLQKDENTLEIIPNICAMRKNQADGKWIELSTCARYADGKLYVPIRKVAEEMSIQVDWDGETHSVYLNS